MDEILVNNMIWMSWNAFLALLGLISAVLFYKVKQPVIKGLVALGWLLLVPNTMYVITDIKHVLYQWYMVDRLERLALVFQYVVLISLGVASYIQSMRWFESGLFSEPRFSRSYLIAGLKRRMYAVVSILNFLIAFAMVMGRVLRTNSWYVLTQPSRVITDALTVFRSGELMLWVIGLFVVVQGVYLLSLLTHSSVAK